MWDISKLKLYEMSHIRWDKDIKIRDGWEYYPDGVKLGTLPTEEPVKTLVEASS